MRKLQKNQVLFSIYLEYSFYLFFFIFRFNRQTKIMSLKLLRRNRRMKSQKQMLMAFEHLLWWVIFLYNTLYRVLLSYQQA